MARLRIRAVLLLINLSGVEKCIWWASKREDILTSDSFGCAWQGSSVSDGENKSCIYFRVFHSFVFEEALSELFSEAAAHLFSSSAFCTFIAKLFRIRQTVHLVLWSAGDIWYLTGCSPYVLSKKLYTSHHFMKRWRCWFTKTDWRAWGVTEQTGCVSFMTYSMYTVVKASFNFRDWSHKLWGDRWVQFSWVIERICQCSPKEFVPRFSGIFLKNVYLRIWRKKIHRILP